MSYDWAGLLSTTKPWLMILLVLVIIGTYFFTNIKIVGEERYVIVNWFSKGGWTAKVIHNDWGIVWWFVQQVFEDVKIKTLTFDVSELVVTCYVDPSNNQSQVELKTGQVNVYYELCFNGPKTDANGQIVKDAAGKTVLEFKPEKVAKFKKEARPGEVDSSGLDFIKESLKDDVHRIIKELVQELPLAHAREFRIPTDKNPVAMLQAVCDDPNRNLPVRITDFSVTERLSFADEEVERSFEAISKAELRLKEAEIDIQVRQKEAEAEQAAMTVLAAAYKIDQLQPSQQQAFWLALRQIEAFKLAAQNGNTTYLLGPELAGNIQSIIQRITGGNA